MAADEKEDKKQSGFRVSDRRSFAGDLDPPQKDPADGGPPGASSARSGESAGGATAASREDAGRANADGPLPPVDFHTFVLSLGSSALLHLGELDSPDGKEEAQADLRMAKHTIDIIGMLQEKTRGNLTPPEERLIESLLFDLRLRFVESNKK